MDLFLPNQTDFHEPRRIRYVLAFTNPSKLEQYKQSELSELEQVSKAAKSEGIKIIFVQLVAKNTDTAGRGLLKGIAGKDEFLFKQASGTNGTQLGIDIVEAINKEESTGRTQQIFFG